MCKDNACKEKAEAGVNNNCGKTLTRLGSNAR
jgi:hypothetical protein